MATITRPATVRYSSYAAPGGRSAPDGRSFRNDRSRRGYAAFSYVLLRLLPSRNQVLHSLEHVRWEWSVGAIGLEVLSESGYDQS